MKFTADTNLLVRALTGDHIAQSKAAKAALERAEFVVISISALCELVWVLSQGYKNSATDIAEAIRRLINGSNAVVNGYCPETATREQLNQESRRGSTARLGGPPEKAVPY